MTLSPKDKPTIPSKILRLGKLAQLAALTTMAVIAVQWVPVALRHYGINWKAVIAAIGIPAITALYNLAQTHLQKVQAANERVQLENSRHIALIEDRTDSIILQLSRFDELNRELNRIDNDVIERLQQIQSGLSAHVAAYGHPMLCEDFRLLQRTVEELRAIAYRFDRLIVLTAQVEEIQENIKLLQFKNTGSS